MRKRLISALLLASLTGFNVQSKSTLYSPIVEHNIKQNLSDLHKAVIANDISQVKLLIAQGADVNQLDKLMGIAPLHIAVQGRNLAMVKLLVENGAYVNLQSVRLGGTPLLLAVWHRNVDAVAYLLSLDDIDTTVLSAAGATALQFNRSGGKTNDASLNEDVSRINQLFTEHHARTQAKAIEKAAIYLVVADSSISQARKVEKIKDLISKGYDVNALAPVLKNGSDFHSALLLAAMQGQLAVAKILLENGADQTLTGAYMAAIALHKAAYFGRADMLTLLSQYPGFKSVLNAQGPNNGYTPLHDAVWHGHFEAVKVLVEAKARLDLTGYDGNTPEQLAIQNGYTEIAHFLKMASN
ncbi:MULTISPECIES: ankyrin repeat domain-containing protein [Pseudoalteromonas]|jgi:ankyrin repeat protein|uniref:ankyrin repeat domain-containing protein n=1 Tax=Pseudoalteromonas TaxID=53246 RepID=UPI0006CA44B4|nr:MULTISPECIES: ankyrin repeat domain-containing protein [Pseudoalteromonas]TMP18629.1 ankyrin repeat domain-containing protein [Pseudoalteromonas sp. S2721]